ncbi:hypothetical protein [Rhizobium leguminosarum]|uniref:hypothetical protein n=1 Tax=Rhizobium leguminosarum TaxID=384 RepID=UPI0004828249|nr:hypothetical protein [Rhizobium leguminosarum]
MSTGFVDNRADRLSRNLAGVVFNPVKEPIIWYPREQAISRRREHPAICHRLALRYVNHVSMKEEFQWNIVCSAVQA